MICMNLTFSPKKIKFDELFILNDSKKSQQEKRIEGKKAIYQKKTLRHEILPPIRILKWNKKLGKVRCDCDWSYNTYITASRYLIQGAWVAIEPHEYEIRTSTRIAFCAVPITKSALSSSLASFVSLLGFDFDLVIVILFSYPHERMCSRSISDIKLSWNNIQNDHRLATASKPVSTIIYQSTSGGRKENNKKEKSENQEMPWRRRAESVHKNEIGS